jgi:hypothetical protein
MSSAGFESAIATIKDLQNNALDRAATGIGARYYFRYCDSHNFRQDRIWRV